MSNPLDPIMDWYQVARDSLSIAARVIDRDIRAAFISRHTFVGEPTDRNLDRVEDAKQEIADLASLALWRLSDRLLDVFSSQVPANLIGQIKQIIEYRNWIAHGSPASRPPSTNVNPRFAYDALSEFLRLSGVI